MARIFCSAQYTRSVKNLSPCKLAREALKLQIFNNPKFGFCFGKYKNLEQATRTHSLESNFVSQSRRCTS